MKLSTMFRSLRTKLAALVVLALAVLFPVMPVAADTVRMDGALGVANVTTGESTYTGSTNATFDQVVKYQVYYHNTELPDSGKVAQNVRVKIALPSAPGTTQTATATISADNSNTVTDTAVVNLNRADAYLQYIPGSAVWRHNTGTNDAPVWTEAKISDNVVAGGTGVVLENEKPCYNYAATVTVLARVMVPGVEIVKEARVKGTTDWATAITAKPGETVEYLIGYKNTGNVQQNNVVIADKLPAKVTYVAGTTQVKNAYWNGVYTTVPDGVTSGGINIGNYTPGSNAFVKFEAKMPAADQLECGGNLLRNTATAQPEGMSYYYNTADVNITKTCTTPTPVYSCDVLNVVVGENRTVNADVKYTAKDGATYKSTTFVWGDNTTDTTGAATTANHTYAADGTYTVTAKVLFTVDGKDVYGAANAACSKPVTVKVTPTPTPSVKIEKMVNGKKTDQVNVGEKYNYTLKVTNDGQVDLTNVVVADVPQAGVELVSADKGTITNNTWKYTIPSLKVGASASFTIVAKVTKYTAATLENVACVNAPEVNPGEPTKDDDCDKATVTVTPPVVPVYTCDAVTLTAGANRTVTAKVDYTAKNGAALKVVTYNWGDDSTALVTDKTTATYQYNRDGSFSVSVRLLFNVDGTDKYAADNQNCVKTVTFTSPTKPGTVTPSTPAMPTVLPNTGAGNVIGLFGLVSVASAAIYRLFLSRKVSRES
ncbi:MAG: DUF11 domain-containing protein [Candidatus Saccharimonadales bacterium]